MRKGVTLVEILIVMAILAILTVMMLMIFNPTATVNKGRDAQRKSDLDRIKKALEEYNNDTGCYPGKDLISQLDNKSNCKSGTVFSPWLTPWPCDPNGQPYKLIGETDPSGSYVNCSKTFKVVVNLENQKDSGIPNNWYQVGSKYFVDGLENSGILTKSQVNYGVSSSDILWYEYGLPNICGTTCNYIPSGGWCNDAPGYPVMSCSDNSSEPNCFVGQCVDECRVHSCSCNVSLGGKCNVTY